MIQNTPNTRVFSILILTVLLTGTLGAASPPELERAEALYRQGEAGAARFLLKAWLRENAEDPSHPLAVRRYLGFFEEAEALLSELEGPMAEKTTPPGAPFIRWAAETAELMGNYPRARQYFLKGARASSEREDALDMEMSALEIGLLLGEIEETEVRIRELLPQYHSDSRLSRGLLILSRTLHLGGRDAESWKAAQEMVQKQATPEALLWISSLASSLGKGEDGYLDQLREEYPMSPQALIGQGRGSIKPDPLSLGLGVSRLIETDEPTEMASLETSSEGPSPQPASSEPSRDTEPVGLTGAIQIGSFLDQVNALELVKALKNLGWDADIRPLDQDGKVYHRVQVVNLPVDSLSKELEKLKQKGFYGFTLR